MSNINEVKLADRMDYLSSFPDKFFDWGIDDPPYFHGPEKKEYYGARASSVTERGSYKPIDNWEIPTKEYFDLFFRKTKNQIIWGVNYYDYKFGPGRIVWDKVNGESSFSDCELAFCSAHESVRLFRYMWNGMMQGVSINHGAIQQGNKKLNEKRIHPTQKPIPLYKWTYLKYVKKGMRVFDGHVGSGSHRIVAYDFGCDFYGCEKNAYNFNNQEERFIAHVKTNTNQIKLL